MKATFTCPKCGRHGSIKKKIPPGAKVRCLGCQSRFSPELGQETALDEGAASMGAILPELAENKRKETQPPPRSNAPVFLPWKEPPIVEWKEPRLDGSPRLPVPETQDRTKKPTRWVLATSVMAFLFLLVGGSILYLNRTSDRRSENRGSQAPPVKESAVSKPEFNKSKFVFLQQIAKRIEIDKDFGDDPPEADLLLEEFATELSTTRLKVSSESERDCLNLYTLLFDYYHDIGLLKGLRAQTKELQEFFRTHAPIPGLGDAEFGTMVEKGYILIANKRSRENPGLELANRRDLPVQHLKMTAWVSADALGRLVLSATMLSKSVNGMTENSGELPTEYKNISRALETARSKPDADQVAESMKRKAEELEKALAKNKVRKIRETFLSELAAKLAKNVDHALAENHVAESNARAILYGKISGAYLPQYQKLYDECLDHLHRSGVLDLEFDDAFFERARELGMEWARSKGLDERTE